MSIEKIPPQSIETEQAVLSAMMTSAHAIDVSLNYLNTQSFYRASHQLLFDAICKMHINNKAVDQVTLYEYLKSQNKVDEIGGVVYLAKLAAEVATASNIKYHCEIVRSKALSREIIKISSELVTKAYHETDSTQDLIADTVKHLDELNDQSNEGRLVKLEDLLTGTITRIEQRRQNKGPSGVLSGFQEMDRTLSGFQSGELIIIAARPSIGKSSLGLQIAFNAARTGKGVAFFSCEMAKEQLMERLISSVAQMDLRALRTGEFKEESWTDLLEASTCLSELSVYLDDTPAINPHILRSRLRHIRRTQPVDLVIVDYLQLMRPDGRYQSREQDVASLSRDLKALAKTEGLPVMALAQLNRASESRNGRRPTMADIRESGSVEADADVVMLLHRPEFYGQESMKVKGEDISSKGKIEIIIDKNRNGPTGSFVLAYDLPTQRFSDHEIISYLEAPNEMQNVSAWWTENGG